MILVTDEGSTLDASLDKVCKYTWNPEFSEDQKNLKQM